MRPLVHIPKPCPVNSQALAPTKAGWHCARCQTEVIDFARLSEAEILAYLAERRGQRVCAAIPVPLLPQHPKRPRGARRWLLVLATLLGGPRLTAWAGLPPVPLAAVKLPFFQPESAERIIVRGTVVDDSLNVPLRGVYVFVNGTKYGIITNERGEFVLSLPAGWAPLKNGEVLLNVKGIPFALQGQLVVVKLLNNAAPAPLAIRLLSIPKRGFYKGEAVVEGPPVAPPGAGEN